MVRVDGNNINVPGQITVETEPSDLNHVIPLGNPRVKQSSTAVKLAINANSIAETAIPIGLSRYIVDKILIVNPTDDVSVTEIGLNSEAGAAGLELITTATQLSNVDFSEAAKFFETESNPKTVLTGANIYLRVITPAGLSATFDVVVFLIDLTGLANT